MTKFLLQLIIPLLMISASVAAQTITGKVTNSSDGQPVPGVSISVKGTNTGTVTNNEGQFTLNVPGAESVLVVSAIGYVKQEVSTSGKTIINIELKENSSELNEVVVTAMGIKRDQKALGYAISTVSSKDLTASGNTNFGSALYGKAAGVKITTAPGGATSAVNIQVRGINSLNYNTQPLYVVDGVIIRNFNQTGVDGLNNGGYWNDQKIRGNGILDINPADIENLSVLKGASATALYGSEAANGVIVITTKSGAKGRGIGAEINYTFNVESVAFGPRYQNTYGPGYDRDTNLSAGADEEGWITNPDGQKRPYFRAYGQFGPKMEGQMVPWWDGQMRPYSAQPNNWKDFYRKGFNSTLNAAFSNQTEKGSYRFSYTRTDYQGIQRGGDLQRNTFNLNSSVKLGDRLTADIVVNFANSSVKNRPEQISRITANYGGFFSRADDMSVYLNKYQTSQGYKYVTFDQAIRNPDEAIKYNIRAADLLEFFWRTLKNKEVETQNRLISSATLTYKIAKGLSLRGRVGNDFTSIGIETKQYNEYPTVFNGTTSTGKYGVSNGRYSIFYGDAMLNYNENLTKDLDLNASVGFQGRNEKYYDQSLNTRDGLVVENWFSLNNSFNVLDGSASRKEMLKYAFLGTASLGYKNRLFVEATARQEYSSTLAPGSNGFFYWSANSGFVFSDAVTLPSFWNYGKVRASYGVVGNAPPIYVANTTYTQTSLQTINGSVPSLSARNNYGNNFIRPEQKYETEFGIENKFLNNRLGVDLTYYTSRITDQILQTDLPSSTGGSSVLLNVGELRSKGFEAGIYATPVKTADFSWTTRLNFAINRTKVQKLAPGINQLVAYDADQSAIKIVADPGETLGNIYTRPLLTDASGKNVVGEDGLYVVDATKYKKAGNVMPKFLGGFINTFSYKGLSLDLVIDYRVGGQLVSNPLLYSTGAGMYTSTLKYRDQAHGGLPYYIDPSGNYVGLPNHGATAPNNAKVYHDGVLLDGVTDKGEKNTKIVNAAYYYLNTYTWGSTGRYDIGAVYDNSYIKMREAVLSYTIPSELSRKLRLQNVRVSVVGRNLFYLWRTLKDLDPEAPIGTSWNRQGIDEGSSAATRSYGVSLHASF